MSRLQQNFSAIISVLEEAERKAAERKQPPPSAQQVSVMSVKELKVGRPASLPPYPAVPQTRCARRSVGATAWQ